jgi:hypothetical protein
MCIKIDYRVIKLLSDYFWQLFIKKSIMKSTLLFIALLFSNVIYSQSLSPLSLEQLVNTDIDTDQYNSTIAADENGAYLITWTTSYSGGSIIGRLFNSSNTAISDEISINTSSSEQIKLKYWQDGKYIISYVESSGDNLKFKVIDATGTSGASISVLGNISDYDFDIKGDSLAFLYKQSVSNPQLYLRGYNLSTNNWINNQVLVTEDASESYFEPNIVYHPNGRLTAIYHYYINTIGCCTYDRRVMRKTFGASFIAEIPEYSLWTVGSEFNVGSDLHAEGNSSGEVIITTTHGTTSSSRYMRLWLLNAQGNFIVNNDVLLSGGGNDWYDNIQGELYDNGDFVIVKSIRTGGYTNPNGNEAYVIYGYNYNASNSGILQMNSTNSGDQEFCTVAKLPNGGFVAAWSGNGFQGDDQGVYSRAYNAVAFPGISITNAGNNQVNEAGGTMTLNVSLSTQPTANVTVNILSTNTSEGTVNINVLTFTSSNWNVAQSIIVTGVDDLIDDGNVSFDVTFSTANSADVTYAALNSSSYAAVNLDDDATVTSPQDQQICKSEGLSGVNFILANEGSEIISIIAVSSNQSVIDDADITLNDSGNGVYEIVISNLNNNQVGSAQITITATDGLFDYSGDFEVTTTSIDMTVLATSTSLCAGESVTLLALGAGNISWDNGVENNVEFTPVATSVYTVTGDDGSGCAATESIEIVVNPMPSIPSITLFSSNLVSSAVNGNQWYLDGELIEGATSQLYTPLVNGFYTVSVSLGNCTNGSEPFPYEGIITSISDVSSSFIVYPNPAKDYFTLQGLKSGAEISIHSITGGQISKSISNENTITMSVSNLSKGVYILTVTQDQTVATKKLVIQ